MSERLIFGAECDKMTRIKLWESYGTVCAMLVRKPVGVDRFTKGRGKVNGA